MHEPTDEPADDSPVGRIDWREVDWRGEAAELLRAVDPAGARTPFYLLTFDDVRRSGRYHGLQHVGGFTEACLAFDARPEIEAAGIEWHGWGFTSVIDVEGWPTLPCLLAIVLHEYSHFAETSRHVQRLAAVVSRHAQDGIEPREIAANFAPFRERPVPWQCHEAGFIRLCAHATWRAHRAGWESIDIDDVFDSGNYLLSRGASYAAALGNEPERLAKLSLADVAAHPWPEPFAQFWRDDLAFAQERLEFLRRHHVEGYGPSPEASPVEPAAVAS